MKSATQAMAFQHTMATPIWLNELGGGYCMRICPAPPDSGIVFVRGDVFSRDRVTPALWTYVAGHQAVTLRSRSGIEVVEFGDLLTCFRLLGVDNARVELTAERPPRIGQGLQDLLVAIATVGRRRQTTLRRVIEVMRAVSVETETGMARLEPAESEQHCSDRHAPLFDVDAAHRAMSGGALHNPPSTVGLLALSGAPVKGKVTCAPASLSVMPALLTRLFDDRNNWRVGHLMQTATWPETAAM